MKISQRNLYRVIVLLVVALYSFIIFMLTKIFTPSFWVNYFFVLLVPIIIFSVTFIKDSPSSGSFPFNIAYFKYLLIYAVLELVLGTTLMYTIYNLKIVFLIQIPILIIFLIIAIYYSLAVNRLQTNLNTQRQKVNYLNSVRIKLETIYNLAENNEVKKQLSKLINEVQYSDYNSCSEVYQLEQQMLELIDEMKFQTPVVQLRLIKQLNALLIERNQTILLMKR